MRTFIYAAFGHKKAGCIGQQSRESKSLPEPNCIDSERYLSWLSLLPLRLNPILAGRRSCADWH